MQLKSFCVGEVIHFADRECLDSISKLLWVRYSSNSCAIWERVLASFNRRGSGGGAAGMGAVAKNDCLIAVAPNAWDGRVLKTLLRRSAPWSTLDVGCAGVWKMDPGARLFLGAVLAPNMLLVDWRCTDWNPISARLFPEDER